MIENGPQTTLSRLEIKALEWSSLKNVTPRLEKAWYRLDGTSLRIVKTQNGACSRVIFSDLPQLSFDVEKLLIGALSVEKSADSTLATLSYPHEREIGHHVQIVSKSSLFLRPETLTSMVDQIALACPGDIDIQRAVKALRAQPKLMNTPTVKPITDAYSFAHLGNTNGWNFKRI